MNRKNGSYGSLDLEALRKRLDGKTGREYWRTMEDLAETPEVKQYLEDEFPERSPEWLNPLNRRDVLRLMGASFALAGLTACTRQPTERIIPYVHQPEEVTLGKPLFYASAFPMDGYGIGVIVESHLGRPTKIEGNPQHPASLGATDLFTQASILTMWDPDRSRVVLRNGRISAWSKFLGEAGGLRTRLAATGGSGFRILTEPVTSPSLASIIKELQTAYPAMQWHQWSPACAGGAFKGAQMAFGGPVNTMYAFDKAAVVVSLASDFLCMGPASVRHARDFAMARRVRKPGDAMNRLYVVEADFTGTGGVADHRIPMRHADVENFARALAAQVGVTGEAGAAGGEMGTIVAAIARDLQAHRGGSIVIAGDNQPPAVHAIAHAMNQALGNVGQTVLFTDPVEVNPVDATDSLRSLVGAMNAGQVETLLVIGGNPVYDAPADIGFPDALRRVRNSVRLGLYEDETSELSHWHIPEAHYLEAWGDVRAFDGTTTIMQPLIASLYGGRTAAELLTAFTENPDRTSFDIAQTYWRTQFPAATFDQAWRAAVHDGVVPNTALPARSAAANTTAPPATAGARGQGLELVIRPDPAVYDGRFSKVRSCNGWCWFVAASEYVSPVFRTSRPTPPPGCAVVRN
jgi:molybdopterin-containing oxidoreductase family iron-sulfur binding subunit